MLLHNLNCEASFRHSAGGSPGAAFRRHSRRKGTALLAFALAIALAATGAALHADGPGQAAVPSPEPYPPAGGIQPILDLAASALLPGYAFAQVPPPDSTSPTFVSSELDSVTGVLTITFSEEIDATPATDVVPTKIHIRESGSYTDGTTLAAGELGTTADGTTISFTLTAPHLTAVAGLATPELTIDPGAVRDTSGNPIVGTFDASTAVFVDAFSVSSQEEIPHGMAFSNDGAKMFVIGLDGDDVNEYALSAAFDVSTATFVDATSVSSEEATPRGMAFSSDGAKMFVIGSDGDEINEYALSAAFDASTAEFADAFLVSSQDSRPTGMAFSSDGAKMFVIGSGGGNVNEYALSTAFDASTAEFVDATSVSSQDSAPAGMAFSSDGAKMFVVGLAGRYINEYTLSTAFDASTATFVDAFFVPPQEFAPQGMAFSSDGAKMFVIGSIEDAVSEYTLSSVYPITVTGTYTPPAGAFVTMWDATASPYTISIPLEVHPGETLSIDWGDGTGAVDVTSDGTQSHTYSASGGYQVNMTGGLSRINLGASGSTADKLASIDQWGDTEWSSMGGAFRGASNMVYNATDVPNLSGVTSMRYMFFNAAAFDGDLSGWDVSNVTTMDTMFGDAAAFNQDLSSWNTASVTDMRSMFFNAAAFNQDLSSWNTASVTDMRYMFNGASSFDQPLDSWDVSGVTSMSSMFSGASSFDQPLGSWNVSGVTDMTSMFNGASSFDQNLGNWYVVLDDLAASADDPVVGEISAQNGVLDGQNPTYSVAGADSSPFETATVSGKDVLRIKSSQNATAGEHTVTILANGTLFGAGNSRAVTVTVAPVLDTTRPFITVWETTSAGESITIPVGGATGNYTVSWGDGNTTTYVTDATHAYAAAGNHTVAITGDFTKINLFDGGSINAEKLRSIEQWGNIRWESMENAFSGAANMRYNATDPPDLSGVSSMRYMFDNTAFSGNLSSWDVSGVTDMSGMFLGSDFDGDISGWNVSQVTRMSDMFTGASSFNQDLSGWDVSGVTDMSSMFSGADSFNQDLSGWDVSGVTDMSSMFSGADSFNQDLSGWDVSGVTDMSSMFSGADSFNQDLFGWDVSGVTDMSSMFSGADSFNQDLSGWDVSGVTDMSSMFSGADSFNQDLSGWDVSGVTDMASMFSGATSFEQNLGNWYVTLNSTNIDRAGVPGIVGSIAAQNSVLDGHGPMYGIGAGGDQSRFAIASGNLLNMTSAAAKSAYAVNITATGGSVFEDGNNWKEVDVSVSGAASNAPTADAGPDRTVDEGTLVTLNGTGSSDPNGDTLSYSWRQTSGPPTVSLAGDDTALPTFTAPTVAADTDLVFTLTVSDSTENTTDAVTITVLDLTTANAPPVADAGRDQTVRVGDTVTLRGSGSDRDGDSLTYSWTQAGGPAAALSSGTATSPTFTAPPVASDTALVFRLTVSDGTDSSADTVRITVQNAVKEITSSGGSGGSRGGGGGGGGGGGAPAEIITDVRVYSVSWDCAAGSVAVTAGPDTNQLSVGIRTSSVGERPVARAGGELPGTGSFTSAIAGADEFVVVEASLSYEGNQVITKIVNLEQCSGTAVLDRYEPPQQAAPEPEPRGLCSDGREPALRDGSRLLCLFPGTFETLSERGWNLARP